MNKSGFTLVELSIVLVIIGLLVGGILVGQSLIESAKISSMVRQIQQFDAGVGAFKSKYNTIPGDSRFFGGDSDGVITIGPTCYNYHVNSYVGEIANFWSQVFSGQYASVAAGCPGGVAVVDGANKNVPKAPLGVNGSFVIASAISGGTPFGSSSSSILADRNIPRNYYAILPPSTIRDTITNCCYQLQSITTAGNSALKPIEIMSLDKKLDDGIANTGNVISGGFQGGGVSGAISSIPLTTCSELGEYKFDNSGYDCTPLIRIGASAGALY